MVLQQKIPVIAQSAIASYPSSELADGQNITTFFLTNFNLSGNATYGLTSSSSSYADTPVIVGAGGSNNTYNFDTNTFNLSKTIKGTPIVLIGVAANQATFVTARLYHIDAAATTTAITAETKSRTLTTASGSLTYELALTTTNKLQHFRAGEKLRLAVRMNVAAGASNSEFGSDPANRDGAVLQPSVNAGEISSSRIYIPFMIDVQ